MNFSYSEQQIDINTIISINVRQKSLSEVFEIIANETDYEFVLVEKQLILKKKKKVETKINIEKPKSEKIQKHTISGKVFDSFSHEILIGATVYAENSPYGTITNEYGFFSLTLPEGNYKIITSFIGFKPIENQIELTKNQILDFNLDFNEEIIAEVVVSSEDENDNIKNNQDEIKINAIGIEKLTGYIGSTDLIKSLSTNTGIKNYGDGSSMFYVRGGSFDQNLILIDDAPIFNPTHLLGFYSSITEDAVKEMTIYKGDFPSNYGGRVSSIIDIRTKDGNMKTFGFSGMLSPFVSTLNIETPIVKEKISLFASGRKSSFGWLVNRANFKINFYDFNLKMNYIINAKNRIYLTFYNGNDFIGQISKTGIGTFGLNWGNSLLSLRWNKIFSDKLFSNLIINSSEYKYYLFISKEEDKYWHSNISNSSFKYDFTYFANNYNASKFGLSFNSYHFNPGNLYLNNPEQQKYVPPVYERNSTEFCLYFNHETNFVNNFSYRIGFRLPVWTNSGPTTSFIYDYNQDITDTVVYAKNEKINTYAVFEPRLFLKYKFNEKSAISASYNKSSQFLYQISNSLSPFTSFEVWIPSSKKLKPTISNQYTISYNQNWKKYKFKIDAYYKKIINQIDYIDHSKLLLNTHIESQLVQGTARSSGIEFEIKKNIGKFNFQTGYTYSRTIIKTIGVNNSQEYPAFYDRPHDFNLSIYYSKRNKWTYIASWIYSTGSAITTPSSYFFYQGYKVPVYDTKNNSRLPDYHRLDLTVVLQLNKAESTKRFKHDLKLTIFNVYGRLNPYIINFNKIIDENNSFVVPSNLNVDYVTIPTKLSLLSTVPMISYNFSF